MYSIPRHLKSFWLVPGIVLLSNLSFLPTATCEPKTTGITKTERLRRPLVKHGAVPTDAQYLKFRNWYLNHSVLDVYVNGQHPGELASVLRELEELNKRSVLIRDIVVIGGNNFPQLDAATRKNVQTSRPDSEAIRSELARVGIDPSIRGLAESLDLGESIPAGDIRQELNRLNIKYSPTWIVTYQGQKFIYEGDRSIKKLFSRVGKFRSSEE